MDQKIQKISTKIRATIEIRKSKINALIDIMGDKADDVLHSLAFWQKRRCIKPWKRNLTSTSSHSAMWFRFNQWKQQTGETVDDFITDLHCLADWCSYGELRNEMIQDRMIVGLLDDTLSEKLQLNSKLMLEIAVTTMHQSKGVYKQQPMVKSKPSDTTQKFLMQCIPEKVEIWAQVWKQGRHKQTC